MLDSSFEGVNRLFVLGYVNAGVNSIDFKSSRRCALPRVNLSNFNILIDGRNSYDQPISDTIKKYGELMKLCTGKGEDYRTGCLLDYAYFDKHYNIIACDLSKRTELDDNPRMIQQVEAVFMLGTNSQI